jgi:Cytochrome P460
MTALCTSATREGLYLDTLVADMRGRPIKPLTMLVPAIAIALAALLFAPGRTEDEASPVLEGKIPSGYRDWRLISVAHEEGNLNDLRAVLGNDAAIKAYREGILPFPDGAIIARLAWSYVPSEENNKAFGRPQSFVAGSATNVQFMVKDSKKYAATGGWGFAQFDDGKPVDEAVHNTCFPCHETVKARDFVFNRYAP